MTSSVQTPQTYRLPDSLPDDLERLGEMTEQFKSGALDEARYRAFRVPMGVYEQREAGTFMLRVRLPAGGVLPHQMRVLADVAQHRGSSVLHVTTRQDIQIHRVALDDIRPALAALYEVGLSTKGGGGNTVRNITACYDTGVCALEAFDVAPYAVAVTEFLLPDPLSYQLPRKYKIGFSACARDCPGAALNDVGFVGKSRHGQPGFAVYAGGGMGAHSRVGDLLEQFVPASECHLVAEAIKRVFDQHGDRKNRNRARLRFLVERIGFEAFRELYEEELRKLREDAPPAPEIRPLPRREEAQPAEPTGGAASDGFAKWRACNLQPQKQEGYFIVELPLFLGDIEADVFRALADVVERHGEGTLRATQSQNAVIRWAHENELPQLHAQLAALGLTETPPPIAKDLVSCAGASTCKLGICLSRGLAKAISDELSGSGLDLDALGALKINISGCPNACGRHPAAQIGFSGAARRVKGRMAPRYAVHLGGRVGEGKTRLAEGKGTIPARDVPVFLEGFLRAFAESGHCPDFEAFLAAGGTQIAEGLIAGCQAVPDFDEDKNYYFDWGADELFSLAGRGPGECGAGVFDLIEVDLSSAAEALQAGRHFAATALAARALLVTRGEEPETDADALELFRSHFLEPDLVDPALDAVIAGALACASAPDPEPVFDGGADGVAALVRAVGELYESMDSSLRFRPQASEEPPPAETPAAAEADVLHDFRGVACPLNYVKTKLVLEQMESGQVLLVRVDEEGARNVPASVAGDGHEVLSVDPEDEH